MYCSYVFLLNLYICSPVHYYPCFGSSQYLSRDLRRVGALVSPCRGSSTLSYDRRVVHHQRTLTIVYRALAWPSTSMVMHCSFVFLINFSICSPVHYYPCFGSFQYLSRDLRRVGSLVYPCRGSSTLAYDGRVVHHQRTRTIVYRVLASPSTSMVMHCSYIFLLNLYICSPVHYYP